MYVLLLYVVVFLSTRIYNSYGYHIDSDTKLLTLKRNKDGVVMTLVMSDEFSIEGKKEKKDKMSI